MNDLPPFITAFVTQCYRGQDKRLVCDLKRVGLGGRDLFGVPVLTLGGGSGRFLLLPAPDADKLSNGTEVVVGYLADRSAFVLGALGAPGADLAADDKSDGGGKDLAPGFDRNTGGIEFDGASFRMRGGAIALQPGDGQDVSIQVNEGTLRVSSNGDASDWAVLAKALVSELAVLYAKVNAQDAQIALLSAYAIAVSVAGPKPPPPPYVPTTLDPVDTTDIAARAIQVASDLGG